MVPFQVPLKSMLVSITQMVSRRLERSGSILTPCQPSFPWSLSSKVSSCNGHWTTRRKEALGATRSYVCVSAFFRSVSCAGSRTGSHVVFILLYSCSHAQLNPSKRPPEFINKPIETESLGSLLTDFFFYYGLEFPYATSYISITEGKLLPKASVSWIKSPGGNQERISIQCLVEPG